MTKKQIEIVRSMMFPFDTEEREITLEMVKDFFYDKEVKCQEIDDEKCMLEKQWEKENNECNILEIIIYESEEEEGSEYSDEMDYELTEMNAIANNR